MKKIILVLSYVLLSISASGQTNSTPARFAKYFNENQPDSIYNMFTGHMKNILKVEGTRALLVQIKAQLGSIVKFREINEKTNGWSDFRLSFERPIVELSILITNDSIATISQKAVQVSNVDSVQIVSPDNFFIENSVGKVYGTLTLPKDKQKVPVVLMIGGSGPTDRNMNQGEALKTNSFLQLANALAEEGIASLRYDKRGVGKSAGAVNSSFLTFDDFINDAKLFVTKLALDERFSEVIVLGHSEGAAIGLIAALSGRPAAYISLCGYENNMLTLIGEQLKPTLSSQDFKAFQELADSLKAGKIFDKPLPIALAPILTPSSQAFLISTIKYDVSKEIKKIHIPLLIIGGSTDLQISAESVKRLASENKKATLEIVPEMNHILKRSTTDRVSNLATYGNPNLSIHENLVPLLTNFIKNRVR